MIVDNDKISIVIITEQKLYKSHYNLFRFLLADKLKRERFSDFINESRLEGNDFLIRFSSLENQNFNRGWKCHFALDLTESKEFQETALPMTVIQNMLDKEKWKELFQ